MASIIKQINYLYGQVKCIKEKMGELGEVETSLTYDTSTYKLKATFADGSEHEVEIISGNGGDTQKDYQDIAVDEETESFTIDVKETPNAIITLEGDAITYGLYITNIEDGESGSILVFQTGYKQLVIEPPIVGTIDVPLTENTLVLLEYESVEGNIYIRSSEIVGDTKYTQPEVIDDFRSTFSDFTSCTLAWTAPFANNVYDSCTEYDIRYANSEVDADDATVWASMVKIDQNIDPKDPGEEETYTLTGLKTNNNYYVYIKAIRVNYGISYSSDASSSVYFKTLDAIDPSRAYKLTLHENQIFTQSAVYTEENDISNSPEKLIDEVENGVFLDTGYPDTSSKNFSTYFSPNPYQRNNLPYDIIIDLNTIYAVDSLFLYTQAATKLSIFGMKDFGYQWEKVGEVVLEYNGWGSIDFDGMNSRFIKMSFDLSVIGYKSDFGVGEEGWILYAEYNNTINKLNNLVVYARPISTIPEVIKEPIRRSITPRTVDQFVCTNGHAYQQGRLHSLMSGEKMRMYVGFSQFLATQEQETNPYTTIKDMKFKMDDIDWVVYNNGTGQNLSDHLRDSFSKYGLKPFLTNSDQVLEYCNENVESGEVRNRSLDNYWLPNSWIAMPKGGVGGLDDYYAVTNDPNSYKTMTRISEALSNKFGDVDSGDLDMFYPDTADKSTGLDLISGIEPENEPNKDWDGWAGYSGSAEYSAILNAAGDGNCSTITDEDGTILKGIRASNVTSIASGLAELQPGYLLSSLLQWKYRRKDTTLPIDTFSVHTYCSNAIGGQYSSSGDSQYAVTLEEWLLNEEGVNYETLVNLRDRLASSTEIWLTEFGYGESGGRDTESKFQCYSQPGKYVGEWLIPDRHRSSVKGSWIVRGLLTSMRIGLNLVNIYGTECESNFFDTTQWGAGAGFEMFDWDELTDETPGAKYAAIESSEVAYNRYSFASMGIFGNILGNGGYPISRAYWYIANLRNSLTDYYYIGTKIITGADDVEVDERLIVMCFRHKTEEKGAYAVYLNDSTNDGITDVEIELPDTVTTYDKVSVYIPKLTNPNDIYPDLGIDRLRTGLPTSRTETYTNGEWVLSNPVELYNGQEVYSSYTNEPAVYPDNPVEGDVVVTLPTEEENPYFPIVGPVQATVNSNNVTLAAREWEEPKVDENGDPVYNAVGNQELEVVNDIMLSWRQVNAVCDYIEYSEEGKKGAAGITETFDVYKNRILANVSEFPDFYFFDAIPTTTFISTVEDLSVTIVSTDTVYLWWNNTSPEDTGYQIFMSELPTSGFELLKEVAITSENKATVSGLLPGTTYYFKMKPLRDGDLGTLSDAAFGTTYSELEAPTNLVASDVTSTAITLAWDYNEATLADFVSYYIYRSSETSGYTAVGTVDDQTIHTYKDEGLTIGSAYKYKIRAIGINGLSEYSEEIEVSTLLAEEASPRIQYAKTDKLGNKITLTFDLPMETIVDEVQSDFTLTEDGNVRLIKEVLVDVNNESNLLVIPNTDSLSDYTEYKPLEISYDGEIVESAYGVKLDPFSGQKVYNFIGNYTNLNATYQVNFGDEGAVIEDWNNVGDTELLLVNTYAKTNEIYMKKFISGSSYSWGADVAAGSEDVDGIPAEVSVTGIITDYFNSASEDVISRLVLSGLDNEYKYTIKAFSGSPYGSAKEVKMKINDVYSNKVMVLGNSDTYMILEDNAPVENVLNIDIISTNVADSCPINFMIIEEYMPNDAVANDDIYLKDVTILEDDVEIVSTDTGDIVVHIVPIGTPTAYRISELEDFSDVAWIDTPGEVDYPYTITSGFGDKTLYVQAATTAYESNVKIATVYYRDVTAIAMTLNNVFIDNDAEYTLDTDVTVLVEKDGTPTQYRLSETADLSDATWTDWDIVNDEIPFTLSSGLGVKTIYVQLQNTAGTTDIVSNTIELVDTIPSDYTVTGEVNDPAYGSIVVTDVVNGEATATATANAGYLIESWEGATGDGIGTANGTAVITGITSDMTVTCNFVMEVTGDPVVNIDFGMNWGGYYDDDWNNVNASTIGLVTGGGTLNLVDNSQTDTGLTLSITGDFDGAQSAAAFDETQTGLPAPYTACRDTYSIDNGNVGIIEIAGADTGKTYDVEIYGSKGYEYGDTEYTVEQQLQSLTTKDNISDIVTWTDITCDSEGKITISVKGADTYPGYIGYIKLTIKD